MPREKTLEIILRAKDQMSSETRSAARGTDELRRSLKKVNLELEKAGRKRTRTRIGFEGTLDRGRLDALREAARLGDRQAAQQATLLELAGQYEARRRRLIEIQRSDLASTEQKRRATQQLIELEKQRGRAVDDVRQREREADRKQRLDNTNRLEQHRIRLLERQARLGDQEAAREARIARLTAEHRQELRRLNRELEKSALTERQRLRLKEQITRAEQLHRAEVEQASRVPSRLERFRRGALPAGRALGGGLIGGALAGSGAFLPGLGVGALGAGGGPLALAAGGVGLASYAATRASVESLKTFAEFEKAMVRVRVLTRATADEFDRLKARARELGRSTIFDPTEVAKAQSRLGQAGFKPAEIEAVIKPTLDLAALGELSIDEAATIAARTVRGFRADADDFTNIADAMAFAATRSATDVRELGAAMEFIAPIAAASGESVEDVLVKIQALSDAGLAGEKSGTGLRQVLLKLAAPSVQAQAAMKRLNVEVNDAAGNMRPLADIIADFQEGLEGLGTGEKLNILGDVFESRAANAFAVLLGKGRDELQAMRAEMDAYEGVANDAQAVTDNLSGAFTRLKSAITDLKVGLGETQSGAIRDPIEALAFTTNLAGSVFAQYANSGAVKESEHPTFQLASSLVSSAMLDLFTGGSFNPVRDAIMQEDRERREAAAMAAAIEAKLRESEQRVRVQKLARRRGITEDRAGFMLEDRDRLAGETDRHLAQLADLGIDPGASSQETLDLLTPKIKELEAFLTQWGTQRVMRLAEDSHDEAARMLRQKVEQVELQLAMLQSQADTIRKDLFEQRRERFQAVQLKDYQQRAASGDDQAAQHAAQLAERIDFRRRQREIEGILDDPHLPEADRQVARDMLDRLDATQDDRERKAIDDVREQVRRRDQRDTQSRESTILRARLIGLDSQARAGSRVAEIEAQRLRIAEQYRAERHRILDLLRDEKLSAQQKTDAQRALADLEQAEARDDARVGRDTRRQDRAPLVEAADLAITRFANDPRLSLRGDVDRLDRVSRPRAAVDPDRATAEHTRDAAKTARDQLAKQDRLVSLVEELVNNNGLNITVMHANV